MDGFKSKLAYSLFTLFDIALFVTLDPVLKFLKIREIGLYPKFSILNHYKGYLKIINISD